MVRCRSLFWIVPSDFAFMIPPKVWSLNCSRSCNRMWENKMASQSWINLYYRKTSRRAQGLSLVIYVGRLEHALFSFSVTVISGSLLYQRLAASTNALSGRLSARSSCVAPRSVLIFYSKTFLTADVTSGERRREITHPLKQTREQGKRKNRKRRTYEEVTDIQRFVRRSRSNLQRGNYIVNKISCSCRNESLLALRNLKARSRGSLMSLTHQRCVGTLKKNSQIVRECHILTITA